MLFIRLGKLADKIVGKTADGKRRAIRWPASLLGLKKARNKTCVSLIVSLAFLAASASMTVLPFLAATSLDELKDDSIILSLIALGLMITSLACFYVYYRYDYREQDEWYWASRIIAPLDSKDPYLDLRLAAFLTVGTMPEWLRNQMSRKPEEETSPQWPHLTNGLQDERPGWMPEWRRARLAGEPYSGERAGLDYLELVSSIELWNEAPRGSFHDKSFPGVDYKLHGSLKDAVVEIILFLSSLPDSGKEPSEDAMEAIMSTIDRLATIDGESFTEAVHRFHEEAEDEKKAAEDKARG